jgi:hypothetical protein
MCSLGERSGENRREEIIDSGLSHRGKIVI